MTIKTQKVSNRSNSGRSDLMPLNMGGLDYAVIFNAASNGIAFSERTSGRIIDVNAKWIRSTGIAREKAIGKTGLELGLWANQTERESCLLELKKKGRIVDHEIRLMIKSMERPHLVSAETVEMGGKQCILWEFRDITEQNRITEGLIKSEEKVKSLLAASEKSRRALLSILEDEKLAKEALRESETKFRAVFEGSRDAINVSKKGVQIFGNPAFLKLYGYESNEEIAGTSIIDHIAPSHRQQLIQNIHRRAAGEPVPAFYETRGIKTDGTEFDEEINVSAYELNGEVYSIAVIRDITERKRAQESLEISETRFREMFNSMSSGVAVYEAVDDGADFVFKDFNASGLKLEKISLENVIGRRVTEAFPGIRTMGLLDVFSRVWKTGKPERHPMAFYKDNRLSAWRENYVYKLPSGEIVAVYDDVTERQKAQEALRESKERYRIIFENTGTATVLIEEDATIILANTEFERLSGFSKYEIESRKKWIDFVVKEDLARMLEQHRLRRENKETALKQYEFRFITRSGNIRNIAHITDVIPGTKRSVASLVDITERKQAAEQLQEERNLLRTLIDHMPDGVYIKNKEGRILGYNKSLAESWEARDRDDIIGKTDFDLFKPEVAQQYFEEEQKIMQTGQPIINKEAQCTDNSGNPNFLLVTKVPLLDSAGKITGLVGIHRDITERKKNEETILRLNKILTMIADISQQILQTQDKHLLLKKICDVIVKYAYRMVWIGFCDENSKLIIPEAQAGFEEGYLASIKITFDDTMHGMGPSGMAVKTAKPNIMRFIATDPRFEPWRTEATKRGYRSSAAIPIFRENKVIGVLNVYSDTEDVLGEEEVQLLEGLTNDISTGLRGIDEQTRRCQAEQTLLEYQKRLKQLASKLTLVEEQERRRIAGELHDEVSQTLAMAKIKLNTLQSLPISETSAALLEEINSYIKKVIQETRTLTFELSNPLLYELGFEAAVTEWLSENVGEKHGIATELQDDGQPKPLSDDLKAMLFRNTRELLTNCIKHASAKNITVKICRIDDTIQVTVEDNGIGFDPAQLKTTGKKPKFGLFSIRENLENIGGRFEIDSKPGVGCRAIMTAPIENQNNKKEV